MRLNDGHSTQVSFALNANVRFWQKNVTPPALDGGDKISHTSMKNTLYETALPRKLLAVGDMTFKASYDPIAYVDILALINKNQLITVTFPDGQVVKFYGWIAKFAPEEVQIGQQPMAEVTICASNIHSSSGNEAGPFFA